MRTLLVLIFLVLFFFISIPLWIVLLVVGLYSLELRAVYSQRIIKIFCKVLLFLSGVKTTVIGLDNIPEDGGLLFIFNHRSFFDVAISYATMSKLSGFIAKKELKKVPLINIWIWFLNCLLIDRKDLKQSLKVILEGIEMVKRGHSIFIAPEGTRNREKELLPFKKGSLKIADKTGCPVIPVSISNADNIFETHFPWVRRTHVIIEYGRPIIPKELDKEDQRDLAGYVQNIIKETLNKNEALIEF